MLAHSSHNIPHRQFSTGLVSVTFRKLPPPDVVTLVQQARLDGIEWGGDVHVPHGDVAAARVVRRMTEDAGLRVMAYGSYFRCRADEPFEPVLTAALALGAPLIRVWAGQVGSSQADEAYRAVVVEQARRAVELSAQHGIGVAFEFHENTLTDAVPSAINLLHSVPGTQTLWQPPHTADEDARLSSLRAVLPWLANVHVFHWRLPERDRRPLSEAAELWRKRLAVAASADRPVAALLEFVRDDDLQQFLADAAQLRTLVGRTQDA